MKNIFYLLVFPGFLFTATAGLLASWVDRKVTARVQWRVGPPWYQPFADFFKLLGKETIIPKEGSAFIFLLSPAFGLAAITFTSGLLWKAIFVPNENFAGDLIVVLYLLAIPAISVITGGFASKNPFAFLGASREMKLMLAYELPFILSIFVPVIISGGVIKLEGLLELQRSNGIFLTHISAVIAFLVSIICMQAKLTLAPFDAPEAETEIMGGAYIEYSGIALALYKLSRAMALFVVPLFLIIIFCGGISFSGLHALWGILKLVGLIAITTLIRNTNPRVRIDQAVRFFLGPMTALAMVAVLLAFLGS